MGNLTGNTKLLVLFYGRLKYLLVLSNLVEVEVDVHSTHVGTE